MAKTTHYINAQEKTVLDLQPLRLVQSLETVLPNGSTGVATLINLNPGINRWYVLRLGRNDRKTIDEYHLENPYPQRQRFILDPYISDQLFLLRNGKVVDCPPWHFFGKGELERADRSRQVFAPLCHGNIYLRNQARGRRTHLETATDFLRDNLPGGEQIVGFVKDTFFKDSFLEKPKTEYDARSLQKWSVQGSPAPAAVAQGFTDQLIVPEHLGIQVEKQTRGMLMGQWYGVHDQPGVFVSLIQPQAIAPEILAGYRNRANRLDGIESRALTYLVAFDLKQFELGFTMGTDHPRVGWSNRAVDAVRSRGLAGPDGIDTIAPLVATGMINPVDAARTVATFTGGFKRAHGAFRYGLLSRVNHGSHYGFIESGVVLSKLQPGLATLLVEADGTVTLKTWVDGDNLDLARIVHARQNGVPIVEWDPKTRQPIPGSLVARWGPGNWSGSQDKQLRTLRAGAALQVDGEKRFLLYGYFSTATPSAMARVFQAYGVRYALHLDMNALEHTYLALYLRKGNNLAVQHLIQGMSVLDKSDRGGYIPRFLGYPDNRDFFYLMRREQ